MLKKKATGQDKVRDQSLYAEDVILYMLDLEKSITAQSTDVNDSFDKMFNKIPKKT